MGFQQGQGRGILVRKLVDYHGYNVIPATKIVNQVISILVQAIKQGKNIEIPGLGTIEIKDMSAKQKRQIVEGMACGRTVLTVYKKAKVIRLKPNPTSIKEY